MNMHQARLLFTPAACCAPTGALARGLRAARVGPGWHDAITDDALVSFQCSSQRSWKQVDHPRKAL